MSELPKDDALQSLVEQIASAVREAAAAPVPQMYDADDSATYCGISRAALYRLLAADKFPRACRIDGVGPRWRRADLDRWVSAQKPGRR